MIPQDITRTAISNCARLDGTKSQRRKRIEYKYFSGLLFGILVIPVLLMGIHAGLFVLLNQLHVESIPKEWVDEIERADTNEGEVGDALEQFTEWNQQQQNFAHSAPVYWYNELQNNWIFLAADSVLLGILLYWVIGPFYMGLVAMYREGVEERSRLYIQIDHRRAEGVYNDGDLADSDELILNDSGLNSQYASSATPLHSTDPYRDMNDFIVEISEVGFIPTLFKGLALPGSTRHESTNKENSTSGNVEQASNEPNENVNSSLRSMLRRQIAQRAPHMERLHEAENELQRLREAYSTDELKTDYPAKIDALETEIQELKLQIRNPSLKHNSDSTQENRMDVSRNENQAVLFCLMDVSGSLSKTQKEIAKRFFVLFHLLLKQNYDRVNVVYIRHHTSAQEVDEENFFQSRETGGTVISSALKLMHQILQTRYPTLSWNVYAAQVSDGDNWGGDSPLCGDLLNKQLLPRMQYYTYIQTTQASESTLWQEYEPIASEHTNFVMQSIGSLDTLYPLFREVFDQQHS